MRRLLVGIVLLSLLVVASLAVLWPRPGGSPGSAPVALVSTLRSEPRSFSVLLAQDRASLTVSQLINSPLLRVNNVTQAIEPVLAASWATEPDGLRVRMTLRPDARFSDGTPVTADDVVFSLACVYDARVGSRLVESLRVAGQPLIARALDARTVLIEYPAPFGPGLRPLHAVPIVPRARYAAALAAGTLNAAWAPGADPAGMVGAGPFVIDRYDPGVAVHLRRNPHALQRPDTGDRLPRADTLRIDLVPSQDAEMLRLASGATDMTTAELRPEDLPQARALAAQQRLQVFDLGPAPEADFLWFNLSPGAPGGQLRAWLRRGELREAIAHAVDRAAFVNAVYQGEGVQVSSVITPGNHLWHAPGIQPRPYSRDLAGDLLDRIGVRDRNGDGLREDVHDQPARFTLLVQQGNSVRQRAAAVLQESLRRIGLQVDIASLSPGGLFEQVERNTYDAMYHGLPGSDLDPSGLMEFWLSSGQFHLWHPRQATPATDWEARIDALMTRQLSVTDQDARRQLVFEVQRILDRELPILVFAAPRVTIATSARLSHVRPGLLSPQVLWDAAAIGVR